MIPIRDDAPRFTTPWVNYFIIALNSLVFLFEVALAPEARSVLIYHFGVVPAQITALVTPHHGALEPALLPVLTSMFLHGSWMHLIGNMWFLWIFGDNIEDSMGHVRYAIFYLTCGVAAALLQVFVSPASGIPMVGASGAISGVMGGYLVLYPRVRVFALLILGFFVTSIALPAC